MALTTTRLRAIPIKEKMTCIVLFGDTSQGKSTTLNHLIVLLTGGGTLKKLFRMLLKEHSQ